MRPKSRRRRVRCCSSNRTTFRIVVRQSSDVVAIDDREIAEAVRFIRRNACAGIAVRDVLRAVPVSRTALERRMRQVLGRSPKAEITRIQLDRIRSLLIETDLPLAGIAERAGFRYPQYMCSLFRQTFGLTPGEFRNRNRGLRR